MTQHLPGIMPDTWIREQAQNNAMISPFKEKLSSEGKISYGLSSYGYDARTADEYLVFTNTHATIVDPKNFNQKAFVKIQGEGHCIIPPNSFVLTRTVEYFKIPEDVMVICLGKSTYARCGIVVNVTPLEPAWEGHVTIEISNTTPLPAKIYSDEGICQFLFFQGSRPEVNYASRGGKYMHQQGVALPRMK